MKKVFIIGVIVFITALYAIADDRAFYFALQNCSSYNGSGHVNTEGMNVEFKNQIIGWENDKCVYKEYVNYAGLSACTTCKLSKNQINELVNVMRAYSTVQEYSGEQLDTSSLSNVQNNPVVKVWSKYLQDSSVCTLELPN